MIGLSWAVSFFVLGVAYHLNAMVGQCLEIIMIFYCFSTRSLSCAAIQIYNLLVENQIEQARLKLSFIVGRDVTQYEKDDMARAVVETVAENYVDGVLSPLFFAAVGGAPLAMAYKMVNTLDSMVGYKNQQYLQFGWASARIDDAANYIPARLSVIIIFLCAWLVAGYHTALRALRTALSEGAHHSSPNAGYPEAAFAGTLSVKLGGPNTYGGILVEKPFIGKRFGSVRLFHIKMASDMMLLSAWIGLITGSCLQVIVSSI
jgi:adenosylcobinamide-phosphate synthase